MNVSVITDIPECFTVRITEQGLFLPPQLFQNLGEIEIVQRDDYVLIKPKDMTARFKGFVQSRLTVEDLLEDYELSLFEGVV